MQKSEIKIRPYARLLTMLGDQLIKNEIVALTELIKNSYDANASFCNLKFYGNVLKGQKKDSKLSDEYDENDSKYNFCSIIIEDDGKGMNYDKIINHFINPATPIKKIEFDKNKDNENGRICQGEKGIGRFSMLKLGNKISIFTKIEEESKIHSIVLDFSKYEEDFSYENKNIFLDELEVNYLEKNKSELKDIFNKYQINQIEKSGTIIIIEGIKTNWSFRKIEELKKEILRFFPISFSNIEKGTKEDPFEINIYINNEKIDYKDEKIEMIKNIIDNKALYHVEGSYNQKTKEICFNYKEAESNFITKTISFNSKSKDFYDLNSISYVKKIFKETHIDSITTSCGSFSFSFYIFDFSSNSSEPYGLSKQQKDVVRDYRVFLYRDNIRVLPYGSPNDDWLQIDRNRASDKASNMFSNDQLIGEIKITKKENVLLKDKTSREGIIEDDDSFMQFISIIKVFLSYFRTRIYQVYKFKQEKKEAKNKSNKEDEFNELIFKLKNYMPNNKDYIKDINSINENFSSIKKSFQKKIDIVEDLAGVGISVETASHDIMMSINLLNQSIQNIYQKISYGKILKYNHVLGDEIVFLKKESEKTLSLIGFILSKMKNIQQVFASSKQRKRNIRVLDIVKKIYSIYEQAYLNKNIKFEIEEEGSPVTAKTIDAVLYQVFINLFDNSLYWLQENDSDEKKVKILFDGRTNSVIFSDNGIGVREEDSPYIFDAFYSGKGEEGRGLGLYIAKRLLNRYNYDIELLRNKKEKIQKGANFIISFLGEEYNAT